jgi:ribosomal protein S4
MGDPKYPRRVWRKPKRPLNYELKMEELKTLGTFGLRTKRELWKAHTELSRVRQQARSLLSLRQEVRAEKEPILMKSFKKITNYCYKEIRIQNTISSKTSSNSWSHNDWGKKSRHPIIHSDS